MKHLSLTHLEDLILYAVLLVPLVSAIGWLVVGAFRDYYKADEQEKD